MLMSQCRDGSNDVAIGGGPGAGLGKDAPINRELGLTTYQHQLPTGPSQHLNSLISCPARRKAH